MKEKTDKNPRGSGRNKKFEKPKSKTFKFEGEILDLFTKKYGKKSNQRINELIIKDIQDFNTF